MTGPEDPDILRLNVLEHVLKRLSANCDTHLAGIILKHTLAGR